MIIAWCTDDGPNGKKMRQLLKLLFSWIIVIVCWAHQINLVVGDFLRLKLAIHVLSIVAAPSVHSAVLGSHTPNTTTSLGLKKYTKLPYSRWASTESIKQLASFTLTRSILLVIWPNPSHLPHQPVSPRL